MNVITINMSKLNSLKKLATSKFFSEIANSYLGCEDISVSSLCYISNPVKISEKEILDRINERNIARKNKNFELADKIRNELFENGILIEDKDDTTSWKYK